MRVRGDWKQLTIASLLLGLLATLAVTSLEYARRSGPQRNRTARAVRLDDHDCDHALAAPELAFDLQACDHGDGPDAAFTLAGPVCAAAALVFSGSVKFPPGKRYVQRAIRFGSCRAPPFFNASVIQL
ncbi:MAG TPA: hypothetical protein VES20_09180 [Bryobacteraceae bacterium]|nr:hypothetical protein [Bryobacteraceae bacterium]